MCKTKHNFVCGLGLRSRYGRWVRSKVAVWKVLTVLLQNIKLWHDACLIIFYTFAQIFLKKLILK